tara:strand:+ start:211 stop:519 length:309 start_codon:yes stop_codon:yes gene_type:complete
MKRQDYSIKFKSNQGNLATALSTFGSLFPGWGTIVAKHMAEGGVVDDVMTLSEDGLVLTVSRRMTDSCYNECRPLFTNDSMYSIAQSASTIDSCSYPSFVDI